jgi:hypothetical protein
LSAAGETHGRSHECEHDRDDDDRYEPLSKHLIPSRG